MNTESKNVSTGGMGCCGLLSVLLGVAFIILKLVGVIEWSWVWVLAPIWIYVVATLLIIIMVVIVATLIRKG